MIAKQLNLLYVCLPHHLRLNYLNTESLGPTPRFVFYATLKAWHELVSTPVTMAYGNSAIYKLSGSNEEFICQ